MKRILIGTVAMIMALPAFAVDPLLPNLDDIPGNQIPEMEDDGDKRTTSLPYVETQIATTQVKIPAANPSNTNYGERVVTYTNVEGGGVIGERELFTGGTYDEDSDSGKLITASALNNTFTNLPTTGTTKLECANQSGGCTLWTIIDQTAYGVSDSGTTTIDLTALVNATAPSYCYKRLKDGTVSAGTCTTAPSGYGDWGVTFDVNGETVQVNGISACSTLSGTAKTPASNQATVQADYNSNMAAAPTESPVGGNCYCKANDSAAGWVFRRSMSVSACADGCAGNCASSVRSNSDFRGAVFGAN